MHTCGKASESLQESTICIVLINTYRHIYSLYIYIWSRYMNPVYKTIYVYIYTYKPIYICIISSIKPQSLYIYNGISPASPHA